MNHCKLFQIDPGHQLLVQLVDIKGYPRHTCIEYSSGICEVTVRHVMFHYDEDNRDRIFDAINDKEAQELYEMLCFMYRQAHEDAGEEN